MRAALCLLLRSADVAHANARLSCQCLRVCWIASLEPWMALLPRHNVLHEHIVACLVVLQSTACHEFELASLEQNAALDLHNAG